MKVLNSAYGNPQVNWNATGLASRLYISVVTIQNAGGGTMGVQSLKILVIH